MIVGVITSCCRPLAQEIPSNVQFVILGCQVSKCAECKRFQLTNGESVVRVRLRREVRDETVAPQIPPNATGRINDTGETLSQLRWVENRESCEPGCWCGFDHLRDRSREIRRERVGGNIGAALDH